MEVVQLELIYNGYHIRYHLQLMNMDSHITHIHISIIWLKASEKQFHLFTPHKIWIITK